MKCKLCMVKEADKKGSHIVPAFILKTLFERNKEFVVSIGNQTLESNVGRDLTPEKIKEYIGRDLTDDEIAKNQIPFVEDNMLCTNCEDRLGHIESIYSSLVHQEISKNKCKKDTIIKVKEYGGLISLFWYTVIWRYSINVNNPFSLKDNDLKKIRNYININLKDTLGNLKTHLDKVVENNVPFPIGVFFNSNEHKMAVVGMPNYKNPYLFLCNEYIIILYFKLTQINGMKHSFYGLEESFDCKELINFNQNTFNIGIVKNEIWEKIREKTFHLLSKIRFEWFVNMYISEANIHELVYNVVDIKTFINRILEDDTHIADKYDRERILTILIEELNKLPKRQL